MRHIFLTIILLIGYSCSKEPAVAPGTIRVLPDTSSVEQRRHDRLALLLSTALPALESMREAQYATRAEVLTAAGTLRNIRQALLLAAADSSLAPLTLPVEQALADLEPEIWIDLRQRWAALVSAELWLRGLYVEVSGPDLALIHPALANSTVIVDIHCLLEQEMYALHIGRACYGSAENGNRESTCMTLQRESDQY